jgi:L-seryl-tRNA(Ser) seleniumtransferase
MLGPVDDVVMARAGAKLVEVGTTNRTHLHDYAAISESAAVLVHTSNFAQGFTKTVRDHELVALARARNIPFINNLRSRTLIDLRAHGLRREPTVQAALLAGADLVTFSGDKLLGGPLAASSPAERDLITQIAQSYEARVVSRQSPSGECSARR